MHVHCTHTGRLILNCVAAFPWLHLEHSLQPLNSTKQLRVQLTIHADFDWRDQWHKEGLRWLILVEDSANDHILHSEVRD